MIPIPWVIWLIVAGAGTALLGPPAIWAPPDANARGHDRAHPAGFMSWSSSTSRPGPDGCLTTVFALSRGQRRVRARFDGEEQLVDWSWAHDVRTPAEERQTVVVEFLDPLGGALLARHEVGVACALPELEVQ